ncbi:ATP synthase F1 subunit delta [Ancylomarina longa]|uniref:ATP synthase subunit delta n=1 Tax=Ancylomarina longa TaxID=2487017 RepID=A0A434AWL5_9BACT|nr:ATP synthase F1 subunit delta [Ancylomarina longa]RUT78797.1 ATP synthase F1 subunit delta [Ancylomarina longa]
MNESKISVRYAKALFQLGKEKNRLETFIADIHLVEDLCNESGDFWLMLESPVAKTSQKRLAIQRIFEGKVDIDTLKFLDLVVQNRREAYLKDISRNFLVLCRKDQGILSATLTSASEMELTVRNQLKDLLAKSFDSQIELKEVIDEDIIGGFVIRVEDQQLDASVSTQLNQIKRELLSNYSN